MQLWRTRKKLLDKKLTLFSSKSKCDKKTIFLSKKFVFLHWSHRHVNCGFGSLFEVLLVKGQKIFSQCPKKIKKNYNFSRESIFLRKNPTEIKKTVLTKPPNFFGKKNWIFFVQSRNMFLKLIGFQDDFFWLKMFFWTRRTKFCQTYWSSFGRRSIVFHSIPENVIKT